MLRSWTIEKISPDRKIRARARVTNMSSKIREGLENSFFLVVANFCYQVQDQLVLLTVVAKLYVHFLRNENILIL